MMEKSKKFFKNNNKNKNANKNNSGMLRQKRTKLHKAYYSAANVLYRLDGKSGSINSLMNQFTGDKCIKMIYALAVKVLKNRSTIKQIESKLPEFDTNELNPYLIEILIAELLFGEKSFLKYRLKNEVKYVAENKNKISEFYKNLKKKETKQKHNNILIRYIRINLIKTTKPEVVEKAKQIGFTEKSFQKEISFDQFKEIAKDLTPDQFMMDYHFDDILLFNDESTKRLTDSELYNNGLIAMQDKSSLLAIEAMQLKENMKILDACAAPGMKTAAIASRLNNKCELYANDRDKKRFSDMKTLLKRSGVKFKSITLDFSKIDPTKYPDLDVLLLDPSCSGSGINRRLEYRSTEDETENESDKARCEKLAKFQLALLQYALTFNAKKIVYCTCSKYQIENEDVIYNLLESNGDINYTAIDPMPEWKYRGIGDYPFSSKCLRADHENTLTNGFFCCVLQRSDLLKCENENEEKCEDNELIQNGICNNNKKYKKLKTTK